MPKLGDIEKAKEGLAKPGRPKLELKPSWERSDEYHQFMLIAPPGNGKTVCAATISEKFPTELPNKERLELDDVAYLLFDTGGLLSLRSLGLSVPHIDLSTVTGSDLIETLRGALEVLREGVEAGKIKAIVVDTLTSLDKAFVNHLTIKNADGGKGAKFKIYGDLVQYHRRFFHTLKSLEADIIFVVHPKVSINLDDDDNTAIKKNATDLPGLGDIRPDITGQSANFYLANVSFLLPVFANPAGKGKFEYKMYPNGHRDYQAKSRIKLPTSLPADLRTLKEYILGNKEIAA